MLEMGNLDADNYTEKIQNRTVVFEADGKATFLIAVSDNSHYYSGMIHPPSFGNVLKINTQRGIRMGLALSLAAITLLFAVLALYIYLKTKRKNSLIFFILGLSTAIMISYSCVHAIIPMASHPWYAVELLSGYITILMIVILHNRICKMGFLPRVISTAAAAVFACLMLLYGALSTFLTAEIVVIFSYLIAVFKILVSGYLIIIAAKAITKSDFSGKILFYGDIFFACSLLWDYVLPAYEPVLGGWFQEWGCLLLVGATGIILWHDVSIGYRHSLTFAEEQRQMQRQLDMQEEHYRQISNQIEESRRMRHDFRQHLRAILSMSENNEAVCKYIHEITSIGAMITPVSFCENHAVDALIRYYAAVSKEEGITLAVKLSVPENSPIPVVELCTVIGNLFENAIEASLRLTDREKKIAVKGKLDVGAFYFVVQNNFDDIVIKKDHKFISRKHDGFGIGLASIKEIVKHHGGMLEVESANGIFKASVVLPYRE